jgi:hypothetical protein
MVKRAIALVAGMAAISTVWAVPAVAQGGGQSFNIHFNGSNNGTVNASGPISGSGRASKANDNIRLSFKTGGVTLSFQISSHNESFDSRSCVRRVHENGKYRIVRGSRKYAGATGSGTYSLQGTIAQKQNRRSGSCSGARRDVFTGTISAQGNTQLRKR